MLWPKCFEFKVGRYISAKICTRGSSEGDDCVEHNDNTITQDPSDDGYKYVGIAKDCILLDEAKTSKNEL